MENFELLNEKNKRRFGDDYIKELIKFLRQSRKQATGRLINSLDYRLSDEVNSVNMTFLAEDYFKYVDEGRRPGSFPPIREIANWASIKGISKDAAFPIAKSIYKFGIKPSNIYEKTDRAVMNGKVFDELEDNVMNNIEKIVIEQLETLNNKK
jgi:hypothetical protein